MLHRLVIQNFRNITELSWAPSERFNLISGPNGSGKTALLEAIYFLSHGRSFRSLKLARLIQENQSTFTLFSEISQNNNFYQIGTLRDLSGQAKLKMNGQSVQSHIPITQLLPSLLINPELYSQFWQGSGLRRAILDWGLFYQNPEFLGLWQRCDRTLKQRNAALKKHCADSLITLWDENLIILSEQLATYRQDYFLNLINLIKTHLSEFLEKNNIQLSYYPGWPQEHSLSHYLKNHLTQDKQLGHTHYGPHRADLRIRVNQTHAHHANAQEILSRGQQKKLITTLKLAQGELLEKTTGKQCVYLLDDLASELDSVNQEALLNHLAAMNSQVFITTLESSLFSRSGSEYTVSHLSTESFLSI